MSLKKRLDVSGMESRLYSGKALGYIKGEKESSCFYELIGDEVIIYIIY